MIQIAEWIEPITDRTSFDVEMVKKLNSYDYTNISNLPADIAAYWVKDGKIIDGKGALNLSDLQRVTNNIISLFAQLGIISITHLTPSDSLYPSATLYPGTASVEETAGITDIINIPEIPRVSWWDKLEELLERLYETQLIYADTPEIPERPYNTYIKWNNIEKILEDIHTHQTTEIARYAGNEYYAGQDIGLLL